MTVETVPPNPDYALPTLLLPEPGEAFSGRAARLRSLAPGHALRDYLEFAADLADAQHALVATGVGAPTDVEVRESAAPGDAPIDAATHRRPAVWRDGLADILHHMESRTSGIPRAAVDELARLPVDAVEARADRVLAGTVPRAELATAPLVGAALQAYWVRLVARLSPDGLRGLAQRRRCPACGSRPDTGATRSGGQETGFRYLHCPLCAIEWHFVRVACAHCGGTEGISYRSSDGNRSGARPVVKAECCSVCNGYLKIVQRDVDPLADPVADDLATLALDLKLEETGFAGPRTSLVLVRGDALE